MLKFAVSGLTIQDLTGATSPMLYSLSSVQGLEAPDYRQGSYEKPGEDGARVTSLLYGGRSLSLSGDVQGATSDLVAFEVARVALATAFRIQRDKYNYPILTRITMTALDGNQYFVDAAVKSFKNQLQYPTYSNWMATLYAPDAAIYGAALQTTGQFGIQKGGGAVFPLVFPIIFAAGVGGTGTLTNAGNMNTWPVIYLRGAFTNPRLYFIEGAGTMQINTTTVNASDVITIDMANKTVMLNGSTNLMPYMTDDSRWFSAQPGTNTYLLTTGSGGDTGTAEVTAYSAYIGL